MRTGWGRAGLVLVMSLGLSLYALVTDLTTAAGSEGGQQITVSLSVSLVTGAGSPGAAAVAISVNGDTTHCQSDCRVSLSPGAQVTVTAVPATGYEVDHWNVQEACRQDTTSVCSFTAPTTDLQVGLVLRTTTYMLAVEPAGAGRITGGSTGGTGPGGIDCTRTAARDLTGTCTTQWPRGSQVTLTVSPTAPTQFRRWSVWECPPHQVQCTVTMNGDRTITAVMDRATFTVRRLGDGGRITSMPAGLDCGPACDVDSATFPTGTNLTLVAVPGSEEPFAGWSEPCGGPNPRCTLHVLASSSVAGTFGSLAPSASPPGPGSRRSQSLTVGVAAVSYSVGVSVFGHGYVRVTLPGGRGTFRCHPSCRHGGYQQNQTAHFTASPSGGWRLQRWIDGCGHSASCSLYPYTNSDVAVVFVRH